LSLVWQRDDATIENKAQTANEAENSLFRVCVKANTALTIAGAALADYTHQVESMSRDFLPPRYTWDLSFVASSEDESSNSSSSNATKLLKHKRKGLSVITIRCVPIASESEGDSKKGMSALSACRLANKRVDQMQSQNANSLKRKKVADVITKPLPATDAEASAFEQQHVHAVYDTIAQHFSDTRYKPWPQVVAFLEALPEGASVADVGCGNGKYMGVNPALVMRGCDMSDKFVAICKQRGYDVVQGDTMAIPFASEAYDAVLSIAVFHHISTEARRLTAMRELVRLLKPGGTLLLCAWAKEQKEQDARRKFDSSDVWVEWNLPVEYSSTDQQQQQQQEEKATLYNATKRQRGQGKHTVKHQRYCHVYLPGELEALFNSLSDARVVKSNYDTGNYFVYVQKTAPDSQPTGKTASNNMDTSD
jgi:tRNA (uracil-5-)-methyltransferase TRM9